MKKIFAVLFAVVLLVLGMAGCGKLPAKMLFYDTLNPNPSLLYITQGSGKVSALYSEAPYQLFVSDDGSQIVNLVDTGHGQGLADYLLHIIYAGRPDKEKEVLIPHDIFYLQDDRYAVISWFGMSVAFKDGEAYLQIMFDVIDNEGNSGTSFVIYRISGDDLIKVKQVDIGQPSFDLFIYNGFFPISGKILGWLSDSGGLGVLDIESGKITPITRQGEEYHGIPLFTPNGEGYVYAMEDKDRVCWILNRNSADTDLVCLPHDGNIPPVIIGDATFSPNSKYVAVTLRPADSSDEPLYIFDITGNTPRYVTKINGWEKIGFMIWSPDSKMVGFSALRTTPSFEAGIYTLDLNGKLRLAYTNPDWTVNGSGYPDGNDIFPVRFLGWLK